MKRIALVEDNPDNRMLIGALLEDLYEVDIYPDGESALAGIAARRPDLVLLDISLPELDGTEVLKRLREAGPAIEEPVIALTAHAMAGDRERFLELGFDAYVSKPIVDEDELLEPIARLLGSGSDGG